LRSRQRPCLVGDVLEDGVEVEARSRERSLGPHHLVEHTLAVHDRKIGARRPFLERNERTSLPADEEVPVRTADVFPAGRRLETLLVREASPDESGLATLFAATDLRVDEAFERISQLERRLERLETAPPSSEARELAYVVFLATPEGYQLVSDFGILPAAGERVGAADVIRVGLSPLPDDARPCVFAVTATVESPDVAEAEVALDRRAA
jgi:hypothetical protein